MSILVTGATGNIGMDVLKTLQQHGSSHVKALLRTADKDAQVARLGATPERCQFDDRASLSQAMEGVETLVLITPAHPQAVAYASAALAEAKARSVQKIVRISAIKADPNGPTNNTRAHGQTEAEIVQSGLRYVMLRPNLFMQNMLLALEPIKTNGQFSFAMGAGEMGMIDTRDIAACAAHCALSDQ